MTEQEWHDSEDVRAMLEHLAPRDYHDLPDLMELEEVVGERKVGLFAVACCRRALAKLVHPSSREMVEVAEGYLDGQLPEDALQGPFGAICERSWLEQYDYPAGQERLAYASDMTIIYALGLSLGYHGSLYSGSECFAEFVDGLEGLQAGTGRRRSRIAREEGAAQAQLLRDVLGNPFVDRPEVERAWLRWKRGTVVHLARAIYEERRFDEMPVLGDALEDAGCTDEALLAHCRRPGAHARGCWLLDLLLGRS